MKKLCSVNEAHNIIQNHLWTSSVCELPSTEAVNRIIAENLIADRDLPPFNQVKMDGIAIAFVAFKTGIRSFKIQYTLAAGMQPEPLISSENCIEIMTGAVLPDGCDSVIRYEDLNISEGIATVVIDGINASQNIHNQGFDKKKGDLLVPANSLFRAAEQGIAASIGKSTIKVFSQPRIAIISTGDELVAIDEMPLPWQIRRSNAPAIQTLLQQDGVKSDSFHLPDDENSIQNFLLENEANYDCFLFSGGVSKGKFDYLPSCFEKSGFTIQLHGVKQRPGKPFLFAEKQNKFIFGFPGNPVSTIVCAIRYFKPWLQSSCFGSKNKCFAKLNSDFEFKPSLSYFLEVKAGIEKDATLYANPVKGHGSGDLANLSEVSGFLELPEERSTFEKGEVFPYWPFSKI